MLFCLTPHRSLLILCDVCHFESSCQIRSSLSICTNPKRKGINPPKPVNTTHPSLMLRIQPVWHNAGSSMNSCQTVPRPSGSVRTYPRSGIADIESTERYRRMRWVIVIGWGMGCCLSLTCEMHSCSRGPRGGKLLSGAGGMKVGSWRLPLGFVFVSGERGLRLNEARSGFVRCLC